VVLHIGASFCDTSGQCNSQGSVFCRRETREFVGVGLCVCVCVCVCGGKGGIGCRIHSSMAERFPSPFGNLSGMEDGPTSRKSMQ
jgi:hypothetical protein